MGTKKKKVPLSILEMALMLYCFTSLRGRSLTKSYENPEVLREGGYGCPSLTDMLTALNELSGCNDVRGSGYSSIIRDNIVHCLPQIGYIHQSIR